VAHTATELQQMVQRLRRAGVAEVAIERPDGPVVDALLAAGLTVFVIAPNQVKNLRGRYGSAGNKDDRFDAFVLADTLRTDLARLRPLTPDSEATISLRMTVRARKDLVAARVAMANQLRAHLQSTLPGVIGLFRDIDSKITLQFLTPRVQITLALVAALSAIRDQIKVLDGQIAAQLATHPDRHTFTSLPRAGTNRAARLLAEIGDARGRFPTPEALACLAGAAPSTRQSGKVKIVTYRWAVDKQLRGAVIDFAGDPHHANAWAADLYAKARARGHDHPHAVRILARAWLHVIWRCWQDQVAYDPTKHHALQRVLNQAA